LPSYACLAWIVCPVGSSEHWPRCIPQKRQAPAAFASATGQYCERNWPGSPRTMTIGADWPSSGQKLTFRTTLSPVIVAGVVMALPMTRALCSSPLAGDAVDPCSPCNDQRRLVLLLEFCQQD
jgi:hypothetical protein